MNIQDKEQKMSYKPSKEIKNYLLCSEEHFIFINERMEEFFLSNYTNRYLIQSMSITESDLDYAINCLNYKKFYSNLDSFSKNTRYDVASKLENLTKDFVLGVKREDLGDEKSSSFFKNKPFGKNTEFCLFEFALVSFSSAVGGAERGYWRNFCTFMSDQNMSMSNYNVAKKGYDIVKNCLLFLSDDFFKKYAAILCTDSTSFKSTLCAISSMKKLSVMENSDFRKKLDGVIKIFGKVALSVFGNDLVKFRGWQFSEECLPSLEYILSDKKLITDEILNNLSQCIGSYVSQDSFAYTAYYFKAIDQLPEKSFSDNIFESVKKKEAAERASKYSAYISSGLGDKKFFRKMRSETSSFCSSYALRTLIESRDLYKDNYVELISQFNDSKYPSVVRLLELGSPSENLVGLLGNDLCNKNRVFKRLNKLK